MSKGGFKGEVSPPAAKSTLGGSYNDGGMSAGVSDGLSSAASMDSENIHDHKMNNEVDSVSGNPRGALKPRAGKSVSGKGKSFDMC